VRILGYFLLTLLLGLVSFWLYKHPGYISFEGYGYQISTSLNVLFIIGVIVFFILRFLLKACIWIFNIPSNISDSWKSYKHQKDNKVFMSFVLNTLHNDGLSALKDAEKIKAAHKEELLYNYFYGKALLAQNESVAAQLYYENMILDPNLKFMGFAGLAESKKDAQDLMGERSALEQLLSIDPKSSWCLKSLYTNLKRTHDYKKAKELLSRIEDLSLMDEAEIKSEWADLYWKNASSPDLSPQEKEKRLRQAHFLAPENADIAIDLADTLQNMGKTRQALDILSSTWKLNPSQKLGDTYAEFHQDSSAIEVYQQLKKLTQATTHQVESLILLARYAMKASLWGEARHDLMTLLEIAPSPEIYKLLSQLEIQENHDEKKAYEWLVLDL